MHLSVIELLQQLFGQLKPELRLVGDLLFPTASSYDVKTFVACLGRMVHMMGSCMVELH